MGAFVYLSDKRTKLGMLVKARQNHPGKRLWLQNFEESTLATPAD